METVTTTPALSPAINTVRSSSGASLMNPSSSSATTAVVVCGSLNQLILHLTSPFEADGLVGAEFFQTFMITLQTFTEPDAFVVKMFERFTCPERPEDMSEEYYLKNIKQPVQMRVSNVL